MLLVMSKVDAVNLILSAIGGAPIDTIDDNNDVDVDNILRLMDRVSRAIQMSGWDFNTYSQFTLQPDALSKRVLWDDSIIKYKVSNGNTIVKRGDYAYDMTNNTFEFDSAIVLKAIVAVDFEELPQAFRDYVAAKTAVQFQSRYMGDDSVSQDLMLELQEAQRAITDYDLNMGDYNMLNLTSVSDALSRT